MTDVRDRTWADEVRLALLDEFGAVGPYVLELLWSIRERDMTVVAGPRLLARNCGSDSQTVAEILIRCVELGAIKDVHNDGDEVRWMLEPAWRLPKYRGAKYSGLRFSLQTHRDLRRRVFARDDFTCRHCGWRPDEIPGEYTGEYTVVGERGRHLQVDHIIPLSAGGPVDALENLQTLCDDCNRYKGAGGRR